MIAELALSELQRSSKVLDDQAALIKKMMQEREIFRNALKKIGYRESTYFLAHEVGGELAANKMALHALETLLEAADFMAKP